MTNDRKAQTLHAHTNIKSLDGCTVKMKRVNLMHIHIL